MICVGSGSGSRFGGDKLAEMICDRTVFELSLSALRRAYADMPIIAVIDSRHIEEWRIRLEVDFPDVECIGGGARRQDSVRAGVMRAAEGGADVVLVHDAARPLVAVQDIKGVVWALGAAAGSVLCGRVVDTVKRVDRDGLVLDTVSRVNLRLAQTPQVFKVSALLRAWEEVDQNLDWTDEAAMLESIGLPVRSVVSQHPNPKLTTDQDLILMRHMFRVTS
jgi:2-C-methyl-D-erythritol 4-phosphate cytidylyltransferase/2-C-methyl-D-erythritol 2,4-cyclodiphosphate synthase